MEAIRCLLEKVVRKNVEAACIEPNDSRATFNACASIEALASALYWHLVDQRIICAHGDGPYKITLGHCCEPFELIHDIAEAQKHGRLTHKRKRKINNAESLRSERHGWGHARWDEMILHAQNAISIEVDRTQRTVAAVAFKAMQFLEGEAWLAENNDSAVLTFGRALKMGDIIDDDGEPVQLPKDWRPTS